jgi:poly [ADP-ribose] polymerase 6/8
LCYFLLIKQKEILDLYPDLETMRKYVKKGNFKEEMNKLHPLAYPLLRWILTSNRCHLKLLSKKERITEIATEHQYLLLSSTPEKEKRFQTLKKKYGSQWAFHGSASCNWHAILRNGLQNMSGTSGQVNGNLFL